MTTGNSNAPVPPARVAGLLYLIVAVAGSYALFGGPAIVSGDAAATAANIAASEHALRLNLFLVLIAGAAYVGVIAILYRIFEPASATLSVVAAFFGLAGSVAASVSWTHKFTPLFYLGDASYLAAFDAEQLQALAYVPLRVQAAGDAIAYMFFGLYNFSLGCLVLRSTFLPRLLGVLLLITGVSWFMDSLMRILAISLGDVLSTVLTASAVLGELTFLLWLLVMGVNAEEWRKQAGTVNQARC